MCYRIELCYLIALFLFIRMVLFACSSSIILFYCNPICFSFFGTAVSYISALYSANAVAIFYVSMWLFLLFQPAFIFYSSLNSTIQQRSECFIYLVLECCTWFFWLFILAYSAVYYAPQCFWVFLYAVSQCCGCYFKLSRAAAHNFRLSHLDILFKLSILCRHTIFHHYVFVCRACASPCLSYTLPQSLTTSYPTPSHIAISIS